MTDLRHGDATAADALSDAERDARVEQLLVSGLDEYFAGRLDQAINVWTRVLFLDRSNDRARAYIDRARRAQAERQRETEALLHEGLQAFDEGDVERARHLLTTASDRGAPHEQTLPILHRIGLLDLANPSPASTLAGAAGRRRQGAAREDRAVAPRRLGPVLVMAAAIAVAAVVVTRTDVSTDPGTPLTAFEAGSTPLPVPSASEVYVARAEAFFAAGKLPDALAALDRVAPDDARYRDAQALRARVQRALLSATTAWSSSGGEPQP
jgi:tetratricopeptide (TPR) repeat protein